LIGGIASSPKPRCEEGATAGNFGAKAKEFHRGHLQCRTECAAANDLRLGRWWKNGYSAETLSDWAE